jgi:hypothetical protein
LRRLHQAHNQLLERINAINVQADLARWVREWVPCHRRKRRPCAARPTRGFGGLASFSRDFGVDMPMLVPSDDGRW